MSFTTETYLIAKAFYSIHKAKQYLEAVKGSSQVAPHARHFLAQLINRQDWCMSEMTLRLSAASREAFHKEITTADTLQFDAVFDLMINMSPQQRDALEAYANILTSQNDII